MNNSWDWKNFIEWEMHSRKNVVLMFLIIMLSFAKSIEISTEPNDEAEISDSGLNDSHGLFNPGISQAKDF